MIERSLSDFWRITKSDDRVKELTSVLQGADSMIGVMGSGVRAIWSADGTSSTWWMRTKDGNVSTQVNLDYSPLAGLKPPYGGRAVDEVIGYAAHEGGHVLWSDHNAKGNAVTIMNSKALLPVKGRTEEDVIQEVLRIDNILEDAFIDYHVGEEWPVLGEYIRWARKQVGDRRPIDLAEIAKQKNPSRNHVMNLWIACTLYDADIPDKLSARVRKVLNFLIDKSVEAVKTTDAYSRLTKAVDCWEVLQRFPNTDDALPRMKQPSSQSQQGEGDGEAGESGEKGQSGDTKGSKMSRKGQKSDTEGSDSETDEEGSAAGGGDEDEVDEKDGDGEEVGQSDDEDEGADEGESVDEKDGDSESSPPVDETGDSVEKPEDSVDETGKDVDGDDSGDSGDSGDTGSHSPQGGDEEGAPGNLDEFDIRDLEEMPEEVLEAIMDAISHELEDLSRSVAEVINRPVGNVDAQTKKADYDGPAADRVRDQVQKEIAEMRRVFDREKAVQSRCIKGMPSGKIDSRALAKVGTGNFRVFKRRQVLDRPDLAIGLLEDVSGSMGSYMGIVWMTAGVFAEALIRKPGVNFLALTYTGSGGSYSSECQTTRICDRTMGRLHLGNVIQGGGTPSGEAIASIKALMDRMPEKKKVIIHFTDGAPDSSQCVKQAVRVARDAGYKVWAIAPRGYESMLQDQYGDGNWETIASISELPQKVLHLVTTLTK